VTASPTSVRPDAPVGGPVTRRARRGVVLVVGVLLVAVVSAACSSAPSPSAAKSTTTTSHHHPTYSITPIPEIKTATVTINGHVYPVPTENQGRPISSDTDTGSQIVITDKGVLPYHLFVNIGQAIVWTNLSSKPVRVSFIAYPVTSPLIPTGGTFSHTFTTSYSFAYNTSNGHQGQVDVGAFAS
jgi:hypothetical protein